MTIYLAIAFGCLGALLVVAALDLDDHHSAIGIDHGGHHGLEAAISLQGLLIFGVGFGSVGAVIRGYGGGTTPAILGGIGFGVVLAILGALLLSQLKASESDSTPSMGGLIGQMGKTLGEIHPGSFGEVIVNYHGQSRTLRATTDRHVPHNHMVKIDRVDGSDVHVTPI